MDVNAALSALETESGGLSTSEAQKRFSQFGPNALTEKKVSPLRKLLGFFWGPIPWMIEVAAVLSLVVKHWADFAIISVLLLFNAAIGFWQEHKAEGALEALKNQLALKARARRDGNWGEIEAADLVPGDVVRLRLGDVIPADVKLMEGQYLSVDQAALTGESLPVNKKTGDMGYSGSVVKQGEMVAVVTATGGSTFFGQTARLVEAAGTTSHFQKAVLSIGDYLIWMTLGLVVILVLVGLERGEHFLTLVQFALILTVAAIPVAMPAVLSVTMAVGALVLSRMKAIVSRLESIEELAGMDVLCSDKTGTLTQNKLTVGELRPLKGVDSEELLIAGALASKEEDRDAIDLAIFGALANREALSEYTQEDFQPFDPVGKKTEATIRRPDWSVFKVSKGAPQVILALSQESQEVKDDMKAAVESFASKGLRTLGVARAEDGQDWRFLGLLSLYDPPREDSAETVVLAANHGIKVKMVTGDNTAIARETSRQLGLGQGIVSAEEFFTSEVSVDHIDRATASRIDQADGFAQVFPEHKYGIVKALQEQGHITAMTGDGVNDAPALKQADVGIAVSGATDAARAAADLILTEPGLSVIVRAVEEARRIFERMNSYAIFRITETIRIMIFVVLAMIIYKFYPITAIMIILLALLNDIPIMTIAYDNTFLSPTPVRWNMKRVFTISTILGLVGVTETFGLLIIAKTYLGLDLAQIQSFIFLKLAVAGHLTLFVARTPKAFWASPRPAGVMIWSALITKVLATLLVGFGILVAPISWPHIGLIWGYCLAWIFIEDACKTLVLRQLDQTAGHHRRFRNLVCRPVSHCKNPE